MAGDHHCPLCSATFTRPQHVGRHLRAHTGDRPYECKECAMKFARSDLLSRHVNKAHRPPGEGKPNEKKAGTGNKKERRQSLPSAASAANGKIEKGSAQKPAAPREKPRSASFNQPTLQAQKIYPHHPLLAGNTQPQTAQLPNWNAMPNQAYRMAAMPYAPGLVDPAQGTGNPNAILGNTAYPTLPIIDPPFTATPMSMTESEQGAGIMAKGNNTGGITYEWGFKKRACDQCNHSKVRCDFDVPCLRCTHRNLTCTYNKPQRAKTIGYPLIGSGQSQTFQTGLTGSNLTVSVPSSSPQSQLSSPHASSSPTAVVNSTGSVTHRKGSTASLPPSVNTKVINPAFAANAVQWRTYPQVAGMQPPASAASWQPTQAHTMLPPGTTTGSFTGQLHDSPGHMAPSLQPVQTSGHTVRSQGSSPQNNMAPTPALTSNTTSPSDIDEPAERRSSLNSMTGAYMPPSWQQSTIPQKKVAPVLYSHNSDPTMSVPTGISPTAAQNNMSYISATDYDLSASQQYNFSQPIDMDTQWSSRLSFSTDDGDTSALSSSANSTYLDLNEAQGHGGHHRRRSSASTWANAMAQMSLHDPSKSNGSAVAPLPGAYNDVNNNQQQRSGVPKRPAFPTLAGIGEGTEPTQIPSLSDVKDLWRLFMAEPMTGLTPAVENLNELEMPAHTVTPRPGLGKRTLSKSNSMPDLQSPLLNGPAFFNNFLNGMTPKPVEPQQSYIPPHQAQQGASSMTSSTDNPDVGKWSREIQQRQSSFSLQSQPSAKVSRSPRSTQPVSSSPNNVMLPPNAYSFNRPLPSVVQHSSALQQTLAPERVPSFNLSHSFAMESQVPAPAQPSARYQKPVNPRVGLTSTETRPGNKRLASQTLVGDAGKRSSFTLFDEELDQAKNNSQGWSGFGPVSTANQHLLSLDPAMFAPPFTEGSNPLGPPQRQQPVQQQKWTTAISELPAQAQAVPTQSTSMFYPNWALPPSGSQQQHSEAGPMSL